MYLFNYYQILKTYIMKKTNFKSLRLKKQSITNFIDIKGGIRVTTDPYTICTQTNRSRCHRE